MFQDIRYGLRNLIKKPGFTLVALVTLALGIAANTVIFSVVDGVLLNPFPYPEVDRLVAIGATFPQLSNREELIEALSAPELTDIEAGSETLGDFLAFDMGNRDLGGIEEPQRLFSAFVWGDPFQTLQMQPHLGRGFTTDEIQKQEPVAIISYRVWQQRFGGDTGKVGQPIIINGVPRTLVGVMPPRLLLADTDLWLPMWGSRDELPRKRRQLTILARIKDGSTLDQVNAELAMMARRIEQEHVAEAKEYRDWRLAATPFVEAWASFVGPAGSVLLGAVGFVLLIVCANIAGLLLARGASRRREMAVRTAVGAGRGRLLQQLLTESGLLALMGGVLGLALAYGGLQLATAFLPVDRIPGGIEIVLNARVLAFTMGTSMLCGLFFGLAPAIQSSRVDLQETLSLESGRSTLSKQGMFLRRAFVVVEIALALILLAGAGLMIRSFQGLQQVDPGIDTRNVLTMRITLAWERFEEEAMRNFFTRLLEETAGRPGVRSVALASQFPPGVRLDREFRIEGEASSLEDILPNADVSAVSPSYFSTLGMSVDRGRVFTSQDRLDTPALAVVNRAFVRRYFPDEDPIGRRLRLGDSESESPSRTIVGVVSDAKNHGLDTETEPEIFISYLQNRWLNQYHLLVRSEADPMTLLPVVKNVVRRIDPNQPIYAVSTLGERFASAIQSRRIASMVLTLLSGIAMGLAALGIYGILSTTVNEATREIGIRMALGAGRGNVLSWVTRQAVTLIALGTLAGLAGAIALSRTVARLTFGISATDPLTLASVALILVAVALLAGILPAWRAARLAPVEALRGD
jgi:putative ABC transport system permease protein